MYKKGGLGLHNGSRRGICLLKQPGFCSYICSKPSHLTFATMEIAPLQPAELNARSKAPQMRLPKVGDLVQIRLTNHQIRITEVFTITHDDFFAQVRGGVNGGRYLNGIMERSGSAYYDDREGKEVRAIPFKSVDFIIIEKDRVEA